jgi:TrmH family RNA methyltransferase
MSGVFFTKLYEAERNELIELMQSSNIPLVIADMGGVNAFSFTPPKQFALVIGNEANGISKEARGAADLSVSIPMRGTQESLNAAVAASVLMYLLAKENF